MTAVALSHAASLCAAASDLARLTPAGAAMAAEVRWPWRDSRPPDDVWASYSADVARHLCAGAHEVEMGESLAVWRQLPWDSALLDVSCARVEFIGGSDVDTAAKIVTRDAMRAGVRYLSARQESCMMRQIWALQRAGFEVVDGLVTFGFRVTGLVSSPGIAPASVRIRLARPDDGDAMARVGAALFKHGRLHVDPHLEPAATDRLYAEWLRNSCHGTAADVVCLAEDGGGIVGFMTGKIDSRTRHVLSFPVLTMGLGGVVPRLRHSGVARWLLTSLIRWAAEHDVAAIQAGTHLDNIATLRMFEGAGFRAIGSSLTLRCWLDP